MSKPNQGPPEADARSLGDKKAEIAAVRLLARREHGTSELKRKLSAKGHDPAAVDRVVQKLSAKRLVSDDRFVASFVHHHAKRGQGPIRIKVELRQQGIDEGQAEQAFAAAELDWISLAAEVRRRKFGSQRPRTASERAKQARFLQYRGFTADQIRAALDSTDDDTEGRRDIDESDVGPPDQD